MFGSPLRHLSESPEYSADAYLPYGGTKDPMKLVVCVHLTYSGGALEVRLPQNFVVSHRADQHDHTEVGLVDVVHYKHRKWLVSFDLIGL